MKIMLSVTAVIEAVTGLALVLSPSIPTSLLLGVSLDTPGGLVVGRVAGAALLALATACWPARNDPQSRATTGLIVALLLYNVAAVMVLVHAGTSLGLSGIALWPTVGLHAALAVWCIACLQMKRTTPIV